jgi:GxxExxY protein
MTVARQVHVPIQYREIRIDAGLRLDMILNDCVVIELKAIESLIPLHKAQLITYLKLTGHRLGLLINFNVSMIKDGIQRIIL